MGIVSPSWPTARGSFREKNTCARSHKSGFRAHSASHEQKTFRSGKVVPSWHGAQGENLNRFLLGLCCEVQARSATSKGSTSTVAKPLPGMGLCVTVPVCTSLVESTPEFLQVVLYNCSDSFTKGQRSQTCMQEMTQLLHECVSPPRSARSAPTTQG